MEIGEDLRSVAYPLVRTAAYCANALLFGLAPVVLLVLRPLLRSQDTNASDADRRVGVRLEVLIQAALIGSVVATIVILFLQATLVAELGSGDVDSNSIRTVFETSFGRWIGLRLVFLGGLALVLVRKVGDVSMAPGGQGAGRLWWAAWLILGGAVLATSALSGHAAAAPPIPGSIANDALHLVAGSIWFAGVVVLSVVLPVAWMDRSPPERLTVLAPAVDRFATVAFVSIAVAGATGVVNSLLHVAALNDLVDTGYGRSLVVKLALFVGLLGLGAVNHYLVRGSLVRALEAGHPSSAQRVFRRTIYAELTIAVGIMAATGLLAGLEPTRP